LSITVSTLQCAAWTQLPAPDGWKNVSRAPQPTPVGLPQVHVEQIAAGAVSPLPPENTFDVGDGQAGAALAPR
jgi:hypothetical protein